MPLLEQVPYLTSWTLLEHLQDQYPDSILRTVQRRASKWRALYGPERDIIFRQLHAPGRPRFIGFYQLKRHRDHY